MYYSKKKSRKKSTSKKKTSSSKPWKKISKVDDVLYLFFKGSKHFGQIALKPQTEGDQYSLHPAVVNGKIAFAKKYKGRSTYIFEKQGFSVSTGSGSKTLIKY